MRVLMLGWEFPPFISGGLGTACYGLTRAMDAQGHRVKFVLPRPIDGHEATHVDLLSPERPPGPTPTPTRGPVPGCDVYPQEPASRTPPPQPGSQAKRYTMEGFETTEFFGLPCAITSPYGIGEAGGGAEAIGAPYERRIVKGRRVLVDREGNVVGEATDPSRRARAAGEAVVREMGVPMPASGAGGSATGYGGDVVAESGRYARLVLGLCAGMEFDVIHAHDWMTYPAGLAIASVTGKPLVAHIHSTEFDRSGQNVHQRIYEIERRGMHGAVRVIAVSQLTASICEHRYGVSPDKVRVVYNGVEHGDSMERLPDSVSSRDKIVLYLGRITMQKGPEYFVGAAKRVLEKMDNVKFIVAGNGDLARQMIEQAAGLGIGHKMLFTGFLNGSDVNRVFSMADCYVMPSVSEPFGIAPLEAMSNDVPVIISKQSGVSEVLTHALKVDFWDVDEMANKIIAVLRYPPLSQTLREHSRFDLHTLTWDGAAERCLRVYREAIDSVTAVSGPVVAVR